MTLRHRILTGTTTERDALDFEEIIEHYQASKFWYFLFGILLGMALGGGIATLILM